MAGKTGAASHITNGKQAHHSPWGARGVSEQFYVQDTITPITPTVTPLQLAQAGIVSELRLHAYGTVTVTHGTGTALPDVFGPYNLLSNYTFRAGSNTPLFYLSGPSLQILNMMEYPRTSWEANADPATAMNPATTTDFFSNPQPASANLSATLRFWLRVPMAIRINGAPGGKIGYIILQNNRIANISQATFALSGATSPYNAASSSGFGTFPYKITGNDTITFSAGSLETWKQLQTVPEFEDQMPTFGFLRYVSEVQQALTVGNLTYNFEPGGVLLRAAVTFVDATVAGGIAAANLQNIIYQYGTNKQLDVWTPYSNLNEQLDLYGRVLPQGTYVLDYYTRTRSLVNAKSTENTANVQIYAPFVAGYTPPANSYARILLDKIYVVRGRAA